MVKIKKIGKMGITKFDITDYLDSNEMIAEYLNTVLEDGNDERNLNLQLY